MTPPVKPETGGWWDDFVANAFDIIEGPHPGAFQGAQDAITRYGHKVAGNVKRDFIDPFKTAEGQLQWLQDWMTPGPGTLGAVGRAGGHKAVKKALEKLRAAAVRSEDGRIFEGRAHPFAFMEGEDAGAVFTGHADDEGFIHPKLGYITRRQAKEMGYFGKSEKDVPQTVTVKAEGPTKLLEALDANEGFTYDPFSDEFVTSGGVMVGGVPGQKRWVGTRDELTPELMEKFQADNAKLLRKDGMFVGGWLDKKTGKIHLDVSERVARDQAEKLGRERGELAGFDLDAMEELRWDAPKIETPKVEPPAIKKLRVPAGNAREAVGAAERLKDTPAAVRRRVEEAQKKLERPLEPWVPQRHGLVDASLIREDDLASAGPVVLPHERAVAKTDRLKLGQLRGLDSPTNVNLIVRQMLRGMDQGARTFYPSYRAVDDAIRQHGGNAEEFRHATSAGSIRNQLMSEISVGTAIRYGLEMGLFDIDRIVQAQARGKKPGGLEDLADEIRALVAQDFPGQPGVQMFGAHVGTFGNLERGAVPSSYKVPTYDHQKGGGLFGYVGDTHEATGGTLASPYHRYFAEQGGFGAEEYGPAESLFSDIAMSLGYTPRQGQAGRWFGGGDITGLKSPKGDYAQIFENMIMRNARRARRDPKDVLRDVARRRTVLFTFPD